MMKRRAARPRPHGVKPNTLSGNLAMDKAKKGGRINKTVPHGLGVMQPMMKLTRVVRTVPYKKKKGY